MTLSQLRDTKKLSVREVARRMGTSHITVMDLERGSDPKVSTVEKYAAALGISVEEVLAARKSAAISV